MSAPTCRFAVWRVMGHSGRIAPLELVCAFLRPWTSSSACTKGLGDRNGPPVACAALQGGDPELVRLEVDVARPEPDRLAHAAPGHREGAREGHRRGRGRPAPRARCEPLSSFAGFHEGEGALDRGGGLLGAYLHGTQALPELGESMRLVFPDDVRDRAFGGGAFVCDGLVHRCRRCRVGRLCAAGWLVEAVIEDVTLRHGK